MISVNMLRLLTFGGLALERRDGSSPPRLRPQRLAILSVLAAEGERGVARERMASLFWPDADEDRARHALRQAVYVLRQELGVEVITSGMVLSLDREVLSADVSEFRAALAAGDRAAAAGLATGPFLHGFYLPSAPEFERWMEEQRVSLLAESTRVVLALAREAERAGDHDAAVEWWRRLTTLDALSGRFALGYLKALAARGDRAEALAFARAHESVVRRELEADADPEIRRLEAELRALPSPAVARPTTVGPRGRDEAPAAPQAPNDQGAAVQGEAARDDSTSGGMPDTPAFRAASRRSFWRNRRVAAGAAAALVLVVAGALTANLWGRMLRVDADATRPTFAVGMIREDGVPDTLRIGGVLTDMLATNLARVAGLSVLANSRLFELMRPGQDTLVAGYSEAARRAGATEILQGRLLTGPQWGLAMEIQRVDLASGIVRGAYRVAANDRYALIDSMTAAITHDLRVGSPVGSVADATTDSPIAYRLYEEGLRTYYQYDRAAARRLMLAALQEDSTFAMAAYYVALLVPDGVNGTADRERALRLAARAPERERLRITADLLTLNMEPSAVAVAESVTTKYPTDPRAFQLLANALHYRGDRPQAVLAIERAIAMDSAAEPVERENCRLCDDFYHLAEIYFWGDSLSAAERTAQRFLKARPNHHNAWDLLIRSSAARGDTAATRGYLRRFHETDPIATPPMYFVRRLILAEEYTEAERILRIALQSPRRLEAGEARWLESIGLRNQGRLAEARRIVQVPEDRDNLLVGLVALEQNDVRTARSIFGRLARVDQSQWPRGVMARYRTWNHTLFGMVLSAAGDTVALRQLADTVEYWGQRSLYGRDRRAHHYLRGMLLVARGRDAEAANELREAIDSPTHGFTRVNYELGRTLMRLGRPAEAIPVARAGLHGDIDGANLYMTRTELHELLAQAFDGIGSRDSAAVHYGAVVRAWARSDPVYRERLNKAREWLSTNARGVFSQNGIF